MLLRKHPHRRKLNETNIKFVVFWDVMSYNLVIMDQRFGENRFLTLQDTNLKISRKLVQRIMMLNSLAFRYGVLALYLQTTLILIHVTGVFLLRRCLSPEYAMN